MLVTISLLRNLHPRQRGLPRASARAQPPAGMLAMLLVCRPGGAGPVSRPVREALFWRS